MSLPALPNRILLILIIECTQNAAKQDADPTLKFDQ